MKLPTSQFFKIIHFWPKCSFFWKIDENFCQKCDFGKIIECVVKIFFLRKIIHLKYPQKFFWKFLPKIAENPPRFGKMPFFGLFMDLRLYIGVGSATPSIKKFFSTTFNSIFFPKKILWPPLLYPKSFLKKRF